MAAYKMQWWVDGDGLNAWESDTHSYPASTWVEATGLKGAADFTVRFEMRDGVPEVVELAAKAKPNGRAIRTADLDAFLPLEGLARHAFQRFAREKEREPDAIFGKGPRDERESWKVDRDLHEAQSSRRGPSRAELEEVARIYRSAVDSKPTEAVQVRMQYSSRRTAARRVEQARKSGLLPLTTPGKKNA